jgi:hypothetical protein
MTFNALRREVVVRQFPTPIMLKLAGLIVPDRSPDILHTLSNSIFDNMEIVRERTKLYRIAEVFETRSGSGSAHLSRVALERTRRT